MIELKNISKQYVFEDNTVNALHDVSLCIQSGEFIAIMGASGSGKSTLLNIIGCMDIPSKGQYIMDNQEVSSWNKNQLSKIRNKKISFVFQNFALMEKYTAYENIELPLEIRHIPFYQRKKEVIKAAKQLGIEEQLGKFPRQMSGGQQQRVALARALVSGADIILADEPTGALDHATGIELMQIFVKLNQAGKTIIMVTHDESVANYANRIIRLADGRICHEM